MRHGGATRAAAADLSPGTPPPALPPPRSYPPFLRALQAATPAAEGMETEAAAGGEKTGTEAPKPDAEKKDDSMDESKGP